MRETHYSAAYALDQDRDPSGVGDVRRSTRVALRERNPGAAKHR
jgi:hypothetical protein